MSDKGHVAHFNWGILRAGWEDPMVAEFVAGLDRVNAIAARAPGFVWQMPEDQMEAEQADMPQFGPAERVASSLSVWERAADLDHFVHQTLHARFMAKKAAWFEELEKPQYVLWPIDIGVRPTIADATRARDTYRRIGPSAAAYDFSWARAQAGLA